MVRTPQEPTPPLDGTLAWRLVRTAGPGAGAARRIYHDSAPSVWLQTLPSGGWKTSHPPTDEARLILDLFLPLQLRPDLIVVQAGQSLDGRIATEAGHSHYITGPEDIRRLHRLRSLVDAVVVGAGTVASDNPRLTVREVDGDNPARVAIDSDGRLDPACHLLADGAAPTLVVRRDGAAGSALPGVETITLPADANNRIDPRAIAQALRARGFRRLLIEGGGLTVSRFLDAGIVDRLHVTVAPLLIGSGRPAFTLAPIATLDEALRPPSRTFRLGNDVLFDLDLGSGGTP
ncbi:MAG: RibD family protein [Acidobacteria bacterium]|nr:RibD family protein [Acidobacteriota bacterium]